MMRNISEMLEEIKKRAKIKKDVELAKLMGVAKNTPRTWRVRGTIPFKEVFAVCEKLDIPVQDILMASPEPKTDTFVAEAMPEYGGGENAPLDEIEGKIITLLRTMSREGKIEALRTLEKNKLLNEMLEKNKKLEEAG